MINRMNLGIVHFAAVFSLVYLMTRDPWLSGSVSLVAPVLYAMAVMAHSAFWRRLFHAGTVDESAQHDEHCNPQHDCVRSGPRHDAKHRPRLQL